MGFSKGKATGILSGVFKAGNRLALFTAVDTAGEAYTEVSGAGYGRYTIQSGDFSSENGVTVTAKHILFGLAEGDWGTVVGFGVFEGDTLQYLGELTEGKSVGRDTVPVFKKYAAGEGIRVTLDAVEGV